ncbi:NPC intracellular cholesterol transporter 2-like [Bradysia coprophila]|uniref:NPC intracellular cholesterol transporter 2-like n=1 Tax=Bradysia coprophila TaxID=38358 RepID=UPI00187D7BE8|nr:NPC intracellular cholesterol transporter 2-like [Bradysia coprophila]
MYKTIFAVLLLAAVSNAQLIGWRNCGSPLATVHRIRVGGCSSTPCSFPAGQIVPIEVDATALANSVNLPFAMTASFLGIPIPLLEGNACNHFTLGTCPALAGNNFTFRIEYRVTDAIPAGVPTVVTSTMWNDFGDIAVCIQVDAIVTAARNEITAE